MYTITWNNGNSGTLYCVVPDTHTENLPEPPYLCAADFHLAIKLALMNRLITPQLFKSFSENSFWLSAAQFKEYWQLAKNADKHPSP